MYCAVMQFLNIPGLLQVDKAFLFGHSNEALKVVGAPEQRIALPEYAKMELLVGADADVDEQEDS